MQHTYNANTTKIQHKYNANKKYNTVAIMEFLVSTLGFFFLSNRRCAGIDCTDCIESIDCVDYIDCIGCVHCIDCVDCIKHCQRHNGPRVLSL